MSDKKQTNEPKGKSKKNKNRKLSILRVVIISIILIGVIGTGAVAGIVAGIIKDAPPIDPSNIYSLLEESSFILDANGQVIEKIQSDNIRIIVQYNDIPKHVRDAFVSVEDERFWTHNGIDLKGIARSVWTNLRTGSRHGGSTINQQLAVNLYLTRKDDSYSRKIKDMYYGILLDQQLSKEQILEAYLNTINLGGVVHGVQAASLTYFSKDVSELTIAEAALIAGVTRFPFRYAPIKTLHKEDITEEHYVLDDSSPIYTVVFNEASLQRQKTVLSVMKRVGTITEEEYEAALEEDIKANIKPNRLQTEDISSYFGDLVKRDVLVALESLGNSREQAQQLLYSGGLKIYSTMDVEAQKILEEEYENPANFPGTLKDAQGNLIRDAEGNIQPQSAMVIMDQQTGEIKALVGGRMISGQKILNRALQPRQPGSSIKPIAVYTPAIDRGMTAATVVDDIPIYFNKGTPDTPWPKNWYSDGYYGLMTMREHIQWSSNTGAVLFADMLGPDDRSSFQTMFEYMQKMGISTVVTGQNPVTINGKVYTDETFSTALGGMTKGVTPLDLTTAYGVLANNGVKVEPITFTEIYDRSGKLLYENKPTVTRVVVPQVSYIMTDMLKNAVNAGTGSRAKFEASNSRIPVAGKTGTTSDRKDAWFVGYTPYYVATVWIGNDMPQPLADGSTAAAKLWQKVMSRIHEGYSPKDFERPDGIISVNICTKSGKLPTELCALDPRGSTVRSELFIKGTEPTEPCDVHVLAEIHTVTGKLATELTPPWEIETKVMIKRTIPFLPEEHNGLRPRDYIYDLPTEYYDPMVDWLDVIPFPPNFNNPDEDVFTDDIIETGVDNEEGPSNLRDRRNNN